jgi:hypothetical protein
MEEKAQRVMLPGLLIELNTQFGLSNNEEKLAQDERAFDYWQSVRLVKDLKHRTAQGIIALGLELYWAKIHLKHGTFLDFLQEVDISRSTSSRFMKAAREYMGMPVLKGKRGESQIMTALTQIYSEVALTQHLDRGEFWGNRKKNAEPVALDEIETAVFENCGGVFRVFESIRRLKDKTFYRGAFIKFLTEVVKAAQELLEELKQDHNLSFLDHKLLEECRVNDDPEAQERKPLVTALGRSGFEII